MGSDRSRAAAATLPGGKVLVAGGNSSITSLQTAEIYDSATDTWSGAASTGVFRFDAAAAELPGGEVLLAGGNEFGAPLDSAQIYDPIADSWSDAAPLSTPRAGVAGARVDGGKVLFAGGDDGVSGPLDTAEIYDPATDTWSAAAPMGTPRVGAAAAELPGGQVLVVGGRDGVGNPLDSAEIYNPSTDSWSAAAPMGTVRSSSPAAAELSGGRILVAGGKDNGEIALASAEIYESGTDSWTSAASMATVRRGPVAAELPNGNALVAGGHDDTAALSSAERFDTPTAVDDTATVAEDDPATAIDVLANDTNVTAVDSVDTGGTYGTVTNNGTDVDYTPDPGYCNDGPGTDLPPDTFTYTGDGATATVSVTVTCDSAPDTYYVATTGSGIACTQAEPCATVEDALTAHRVAPQSGDVIDVGPGTFVGNVGADFDEDAGLTIRGTLSGGSRQTTIRGEGFGVDDFGPAISLGSCGTSPVTLRDLNVDADGAEDTTFALSVDGGSDLVNVHAENQANSVAGQVAMVCQSGTEIEDSTFDARGTSGDAGLVSFEGFGLRDSRVRLDSGSGPGIVHSPFMSTDSLEVTRSWIENDPSSTTPGIITTGNVILDSSLVTGGDFGVLYDNSFGAGATWQIQSSTIDVGLPRQSDGGLADLFLPTADIDLPVDVTVDSSILVEEIAVVPFGGGAPGPGTLTCTFSDIQLVTLEPSFTDDCDIGPGNSQGNQSTAPSLLFQTGSLASWRLKGSSPALDTGQPGDPAPGFSTTDLDGNPRRAPGRGATCPDGRRDMGAYERAAAPCNLTLPEISGDPQLGETLTTTDGTWANDPTSFAYQWQRCEPNMSGCTNVGANSPDYVLVAADAGKRFRVKVTAKNPTPTTVNSRPTAAAAVPVATANPQISGVTVEGETLTVTDGTWTNDPTSFDYQWLRCQSANDCVQVGTDQPTYELGGADEDRRIMVRVTATNAAGSGSASSRLTAVVGAPVALAKPVISGTKRVGETLTTTPGTWAGGGLTFSYQWLSCDPSNDCGEVGLDQDTYELAPADVGNRIRVTVTATNSLGSARSTGGSSPPVSP